MAALLLLMTHLTGVPGRSEPPEAETVAVEIEPAPTPAPAEATAEPEPDQAPDTPEPAEPPPAEATAEPEPDQAPDTPEPAEPPPAEATAEPEPDQAPDTPEPAEPPPAEATAEPEPDQAPDTPEPAEPPPAEATAEPEPDQAPDTPEPAEPPPAEATAEPEPDQAPDTPEPAEPPPAEATAEPEPDQAPDTPEPAEPPPAEATAEPEPDQAPDTPEPAEPPPAEATAEPEPDQAPDTPEPPAEAAALAALGERLDARLAELAAAVEAMEARAADSDPDTLASRMAAAMVDGLDADARVREAAADLAEAGALAAPEPLRAALAEDEARQKKSAETLVGEFRVLRTRLAARAPPAAAAGTHVGDIVVEHRAPPTVAADEARRILGAIREGEAVFIRSLRWNGQAKATRDLWIAMGATYALLPPRGSWEPVYRVAGPLNAGAGLAGIDQDDFFSAFSNRYTFLTSGDDAETVRAVEARLLRRCGACAGYRLALVWNWETLALILSEAQALAREKGLELPRDVKTVEWLARPGSSSGRARLDVTRLIARDGNIHAR